MIVEFYHLSYWLLKMNIISANDGLLSNIEVLELLKERKTISNDDYYIVQKQIIQYISNATPIMTEDSSKLFVTEMKKANFSLHEAEYIQLLNHCPTTTVELHLIIEECAERFTEEDTDFMLRLVKELLIAE